jgi:hypothetical protein
MSVFISSEEILYYARAAEDAYTEDSNSLEFNSHRFKCSYAEDSKTVTIAIRGSDSAEEWFLNVAMPFAMLLSQATFVEKDHKLMVSMCSTLDNFSYFVIAKGIVDYTLAHHPAATKIDICGHSRGGLLSVFCGMLLVNKKDVQVRVFAYGAPKLYYSSEDPTASSLGALESKIVWVEHQHDVVPFIANNVRESVASDHLDRSLSGFEHIVLTNPVVDTAHSMQTYVTGIEALIASRRAVVVELTHNINGVVSTVMDMEKLTPQQLAPVAAFAELLFDAFKLRK